MSDDQHYQSLLQRIAQLEAGNARLRQLLSQLGHPVAAPQMVQPGTVNKYSSPAEKIRLFRSLFRGREDVFARRWYSVKTEKSGYSPVCANEWRDGVCIKPKGTCSKCDHRTLVPLSDDVLYRHLSGKDGYGRDVVGVYPIMTDDTCYFLAMDFDDGTWRESAAAVRGICNQWEIPCAVEISRSGEGAHLWIFFQKATPCTAARKLGTALLTIAMEETGRLKLDSYDRMFPCQDTLPSGGFGNLIALPLQGMARKKGNSVFVDESFTPYPDQWAFLAGMETLSSDKMDALLKKHGKGEVLGPLAASEEPTAKPWSKSAALSAMDFYGPQRIVRSNMIYLNTAFFSPRARNRLLRLAAFRNPAFYKAQAMRLPVYDKPRIICTAEEDEGFLMLPRCCEFDVTELLDSLGIAYEIVDETNPGRPIKIPFQGQLRPDQTPAAEALLAHHNGVLSATTAFGKTVIGAWLIGQRKVNTLILVHTQALLDQWKKALNQFLLIDETLPELPKKRGRKKERPLIGQLGGTKNNLSGLVDVAILQSLCSGDEVRELVKDYGMVIVDECHHISAVSFERVLKAVNARYVYGLTATPIRQDGHQPIIHMQCGPIRYNVDAKAQAEKRTFSHAVVPRFTTFAQPLTDPVPWKITDAYAAMQSDNPRNSLILQDVQTAVSNGKTPLVLTERYDHAELLTAALRSKGLHTILLSGRGTAKEKRTILEELSAISEEESVVLVATGKYVGEGFDFPRLDTLFLAMPISWKGTVAQYAGRLHREYIGKGEVMIYDYVDIRVPMLERMYQKRLSGYASIGYKVQGDKPPKDDTECIFDQQTYWPTFAKDIQQAQKTITISAPYLHIRQVKQLLEILPKDCKITILTCDESSFKPDTWHKMQPAIMLAQAAGVDAQYRPKTYQRYAVIDKTLVWYGGINFLGFERGSHGAMRVMSEALAKELLISQ